MYKTEVMVYRSKNPKLNLKNYIYLNRYPVNKTFNFRIQNDSNIEMMGNFLISKLIKNRILNNLHQILIHSQNKEIIIKMLICYEILLDEIKYKLTKVQFSRKNYKLRLNLDIRK